MVNRNIKLFFAFLLVLLVSTNFVFSLSISSPYHKNNLLLMYPGQEREISFNLQNCPSRAETCSREDEKVSVALEQGYEIAQITSGNTYTIPYGSSNKNILLRVKIPANTAIGTEYSIKFTVTSLPPDEGSVQMGLRYNVEFPVLINLFFY